MKDTIISMSITLFILSVFVIAGTDNTPDSPFHTSDNGWGYGYGYGYGYGDTITPPSGSGSRHRDNSYTTTFNIKIVPANDGFDYNATFKKVDQTEDINKTENINKSKVPLKTGVNITIPAGEESEPEKPFPTTAVCGGLGVLAILLAAMKKKKK